MKKDKFDIKISKENVFKLLDIEDNTQTYTQADSFFDELEEIFYKSALPICLYDLKNKKISVYNFSIFVLMSMGERIDDIIGSFFEKGEYFKALMLNCICDDFLMQMDKIVIDEISDYICEKGLGFGERFYPHENIEAAAMKEIAEALNGEKWGITVNNSYVLSPAKSIGFIAGADYNVNNAVTNNCELCQRKECKYRRKINA